MKSLIALMALVSLSSSVSAFECKQNEAQFIGTVKDLRVVKIDQGIRNCHYKIAFSDFKPHGFCPLDEGLASSSELIDTDCSMSLKNGDGISGYLVEKNGEIYLD